MKIDILCVGKIKEQFYTRAFEEYSKRLGRYCDLNVIEVKDEETPDGASPKEEERILKIEGERLLSKLKQGSCVIVLDIGGKSLSSVEFAKNLEDLMNRGASRICFIIGGSLGLSDEVKKRADLRLSFSAMTFPHQLMRVILAEQIYRCFRIMNNEPYHK
ncbi:MAG: 23S rRNA (pseudouridine(1915)-N(3))-methyltransferase RlmH [Lachnospiraceae bacterium]|nr:23S rRNA (pseudouridine(1915)-N(3))-methyltransferase RlmH [Lachnospiraceae bacterium]